MNPDSICSLAYFSDFFWQFRVQTVATAMNVTGGVQTTPHRTHTRALFLAAHARTPDVITRLAQGLDDLFVCLKSHFTTGHVTVECCFDPVSSYLSHHFLPHRRH